MEAYPPSIFQKTLTLVLAGGQGERLFPLTKDRSKPSVTFAGSYRIIDFTLSNCINSGLRQIFVLTQYKSQSLNRHIREGWDLLTRELQEFIETVPPQKRIHSHWYEGTSDAIYQNIFLLQQFKPERTLVLSGDHIYRMDYRDLIAYHVQKKADVTLASCAYPSEQAKAFGVLETDEEGRVLHFEEKPAHPKEIPTQPGMSLINMGIYVFNTATLVRSVIDEHKDPASGHDLGKNVFPRLVENQNIRVFSFPFHQRETTPYWRDVGSLSSYYQANMDLLKPGLSINLFSKDWPFRSALQQLPPSRININTSRSALISNCLLSPGCYIEGELHNCIISPEVRIGKGSLLEGCIVFHGTQIGEHCRIRNAIVDKNVSIPDGCVVGYDVETDSQQFMLTHDNIVVIPKGYHVEQPTYRNR